MSSAAALKAWDTRRANGTATNKPNGNAPVERPEDVKLCMAIGYALDQAAGHTRISATFSFRQNEKDFSGTLSPDDKALLAIRLTATVDSSGGIASPADMRVWLDGGITADIESILPKMRTLDSVIQTAIEQSEDASIPMAIQAVSWHLRVYRIAYAGKETPRGIAYSIGEQVLADIASAYKAVAVSATSKPPIPTNKPS